MRFIEMDGQIDGYYAKSVGDLTKGINLQRAVNDLTI
jgi:hypothetical protein